MRTMMWRLWERGELGYFEVDDLVVGRRSDLKALYGYGDADAMI